MEGGDPLDALGRDPDIARLGQHMRAELRAEAEAYEALAAKDLARSRRLADVALTLCHRGDLVAVTTAATAFTGRIVYAAGDLACLVSATDEVDLALGGAAGGVLALRVVERARRGGMSPGRGPSSFKARLSEHEAGEGTVTLGTRLGTRPPGGELSGRIDAVAVDHVVLVDADGAAHHVALAAVDYVRRPRQGAGPAAP